MKYHEIYAYRIKSLCEKRKISVSKLAQMSNLKQSTVENIILGASKNPRTDTLHKIANSFNMTLAEFLDFQELNDYSFDDEDDNANE